MQGKERIMNKHKVILVGGMEYDIFMQTNLLRFCDFQFKSFRTKNNYETEPRVFIQSITQ